MKKNVLIVILCLIIGFGGGYWVAHNNVGTKLMGNVEQGANPAPVEKDSNIPTGTIPTGEGVAVTPSDENARRLAEEAAKSFGLNENTTDIPTNIIPTGEGVAVTPSDENARRLAEEVANYDWDSLMNTLDFYNEYFKYFVEDITTSLDKFTHDAEDLLNATRSSLPQQIHEQLRTLLAVLQNPEAPLGDKIAAARQFLKTLELVL